MSIREIYEPHRKKLAVVAAVILIAAFGFVFFSNVINLGAPPPPASMKVSLIPNIPKPPPPKMEEPEPEPEPAPEPEPDTAAKKEREAEIIRAKEEEEEKRKEKERKEKERKEKERKEKERKEKERKEKERKEKERKEKERKEKERREAEAAAKAAKQREALQRRADRIANDISSRIINRIEDYLDTPNSVPRDRDIVVIVRVQLRKDGSLVRKPKVEKSSGFPEYDEEAIRAVLKAAPLPMPTEPFILNDKEWLGQFLEHRLYIRPTN